MRKKLNNLSETSDDNNNNNNNNNSGDNQISNFVDRVLKKVSKEIVNDNKDNGDGEDKVLKKVSKKIVNDNKDNGDSKNDDNISLNQIKSHGNILLKN